MNLSTTYFHEISRTFRTRSLKTPMTTVFVVFNYQVKIKYDYLCHKQFHWHTQRLLQKQLNANNKALSLGEGHNRN